MEEKDTTPTVQTEREKEFVEMIANLEQDKANLVGEITAMRKKKQEDEQKPETVVPVQLDKDSIVSDVVNKINSTNRESNLNQARQEIKTIIRELSPDVDKGGVLNAQFEKELAKFTLEGLTTKEDFIQRFKEAFKLMNTGTKPAAQNFYSGATDTSTHDAPAETGDSLSAKETSLLQEIGWTKDKYLSVKAKRPAYVASLLKYRG